MAMRPPSNEPIGIKFKAFTIIPVMPMTANGCTIAYAKGTARQSCKEMVWAVGGVGVPTSVVRALGRSQRTSGSPARAQNHLKLKLSPTSLSCTSLKLESELDGTTFCRRTLSNFTRVGIQNHVSRCCSKWQKLHHSVVHTDIRTLEIKRQSTCTNRALHSWRSPPALPASDSTNTHTRRFPPDDRPAN